MDSDSATCDELLEELKDRLVETACGCGHPACKRCQSDERTRAIIKKATGESERGKEHMCETIYVWPDCYWCYGEDLEDALTWRSDDYVEALWDNSDSPDPPEELLMQIANQGNTAHKNSVTHPKHYQIRDGVEVIDVREWWIESAHSTDYPWADPVSISHLDRALEYLLRAPSKNKMEDVAKAYQYLHRALHGAWPHDATTNTKGE